MVGRLSFSFVPEKELGNTLAVENNDCLLWTIDHWTFETTLK